MDRERLNFAAINFISPKQVSDKETNFYPVLVFYRLRR
jgi:hypothetical protein